MPPPSARKGKKVEEADGWVELRESGKGPLRRSHRSRCGHDIWSRPVGRARGPGGSSKGPGGRWRAGAISRCRAGERGTQRRKRAVRQGVVTAKGSTPGGATEGKQDPWGKKEPLEFPGDLAAKDLALSPL